MRRTDEKGKTGRRSGDWERMLGESERNRTRATAGGKTADERKSEKPARGGSAPPPSDGASASGRRKGGGGADGAGQTGKGTPSSSDGRSRTRAAAGGKTADERWREKLARGGGSPPPSGGAFAAARRKGGGGDDGAGRTGKGTPSTTRGRRGELEGGKAVCYVPEIVTDGETEAHLPPDERARRKRTGEEQLKLSFPESVGASPSPHERVRWDGADAVLDAAAKKAARGERRKKVPSQQRQKVDAVPELAAAPGPTVLPSGEYRSKVDGAATATSPSPSDSGGGGRRLGANVSLAQPGRLWEDPPVSYPGAQAVAGVGRTGGGPSALGDDAIGGGRWLGADVSLAHPGRLREDPRDSFPGTQLVAGVGRADGGPSASGDDAIEAFVPEDDARSTAARRGEGRNSAIRRLIINTAPVIEGEAVRATENVRGGRKQGAGRRKWMKPALLIGVVALVGIVVGVTVWVTSSSSPSDGSDGPPIDGGSIAPTSVRFQAMESILVKNGVTNLDVLENRSSPQHRALTWLADDDRRSLDPADVLNMTQRYRLATLFYSTGGDASWINRFNFLTPLHECAWNDGRDVGAFCQEDPGVIDKISLSENALIGPFPEEVWEMSSLTNITMPYNRLSGSIPKSIRALANLTFIDLDSNALTGQIPNSMGDLSRLQWLAMDANALVGTIPSSLNRLGSCRNISLAANNLIGTIPIDFDALTSLRWLYLGHNSLTGAIPSDLPPGLRILDLPSNLLDGTIPVQIGNLSFLKWLDLGRNELSGTIPLVVMGLTDLFKLRLHENKLEGTIPNDVSKLGNLTWLDFAMNELTGTIPNGIGNLTKLQFLSLNDNMLNSTVPASFANLTSFEAIRLENNLLEGDMGFLCERVNTSPINLLLQADCLGEIPELKCTCCTICCDRDGTCKAPP